MAQPPPVTKISAAASILHGIGAPVNNTTIGSMVGWMNAEGGNWGNNAAYNPINTTLDAPGARPINSVGVKAYTNWTQGINATVSTLKQGNMSGIVQAFKGGNPQQIAQAIGSSPWGTSGSLVAQTIRAATGQRYSIPTTQGIAAGMAQGQTTPTVTNTAPTSSPDYNSALEQSMLSAGDAHIDTSGKVSVPNILGNAVSLVNENPSQYTSSTSAQTSVSSTTITAKAVNDAASAGAPADAQKLLGMLHQVIGGQYSQANHSAAGESAATVKARGTDCSGLVSWLMGPTGLGIWATSYATPGIAGAPGMQAGRGNTVTVWNNKQAGNAGHVFIQIGQQYFDSDGQGGIRQISASQAQSYIANGSDGGTYQPLHPKGL